MRAKTVDFHRGQTPKEALDIGIDPAEIEKIFIGGYQIPEEGNDNWIHEFLTKDLPKFVKVIDDNPTKGGGLSFIESGEELRTLLQALLRAGKDGVVYKGQYYPFRPKTYESMDFERGRNPKESMKIGILEEIKKKMAEIGWEYYGPNSILKWASTEEHPEYIKYAVEEGAWVDKHPGEFALQALTRWKKPDPQILEYLITKGADPTIISYFDIKNFILDKHPEFMDMIRKYYPEIDEIMAQSA